MVIRYDKDVNIYNKLELYEACCLFLAIKSSCLIYKYFNPMPVKTNSTLKLMN